MIRLKVYGTVKGEKRFARRHHYYTVVRDKKGRFKGFRKWSPKHPNKPSHYIEPYVEAKTGKEAKEKVAEEIEKWRWEEYDKPTVEYA